jgi:hypothetical protein
MSVRPGPALGICRSHGLEVQPALLRAHTRPGRQPEETILRRPGPRLRAVPAQGLARVRGRRARLGIRSGAGGRSTPRSGIRPVGSPVPWPRPRDAARRSAAAAPIGALSRSAMPGLRRRGLGPPSRREQGSRARSRSVRARDRLGSRPWMRPPNANPAARRSASLDVHARAFDGQRVALELDEPREPQRRRGRCSNPRLQR